MFSIRFLCSLMLISVYQCSVIRVKDDSETPTGLYKEDDKVFILTSENFNENVFNKPYATEVEFYNAFCGHCRRFAPGWIEYAKSLQSWSDIVKVAAINCADELNTDLCRTYEIMAYPTIRYFSPFLNASSTNLGVNVKNIGMDPGHESLMALLVNETNKPVTWPPFEPITQDKYEDIENDLPESVEYLFLIFDPNSSTIAQESALDVHLFKMIQIRQVVSSTNALKLNLSKENPFLVYDRRTKLTEPLSLDKFDRHSVTLAVYDYIAKKGVTSPVSEDTKESSSSPASQVNGNDITREAELIEHAKNNVGVVHQADLESALRFSVFHELVKFNQMTEEQLNAIKRYISVLQK